MKKYKEIFKYIILFAFFFLAIQFVYGAFRGDYIYNYAFSYAVSIGQIPYKDFNMIIPPFGAYFYAIPFFIFCCNNIIFNIMQSILLCILFYFLFSMYGKKSYILFFLLFIFFPIPFVTILFPGYNFLLLLELVMLLYLEKNNKNDYIIGFILGISILTKQTVGVCLCLVSFYYLFKNYKKLIKRIVGISIPCFLFFLILLCTSSLGEFIDLCILGMFDFSNSNGNVFDYNIILFVFFFFFLIYRLFKDKRNISIYYLLAFSSISIPLFDYYHVSIFIYATLFIIIDLIKFKFDKKIYFINSIFIALLFMSLWFGLYYKFKPNYTNYNKFNLFSLNKADENKLNKINRYVKNNKDKNIIILSSDAYFLKINNNLKINYYDLLNYGNHGYNGTSKIINKINNEKNPIFIIKKSEYFDEDNPRQQINKEIIKYVLDNFKKIDSIDDYYILVRE